MAVTSPCILGLRCQQGARFASIRYNKFRPELIFADHPTGGMCQKKWRVNTGKTKVIFFFDFEVYISKGIEMESNNSFRKATACSSDTSSETVC